MVDSSKTKDYQNNSEHDATCPCPPESALYHINNRNERDRSLAAVASLFPNLQRTVHTIGDEAAVVAAFMKNCSSRSTRQSSVFNSYDALSNIMKSFGSPFQSHDTGACLKSMPLSRETTVGETMKSDFPLKSAENMLKSMSSPFQSQESQFLPELPSTSFEATSSDWMRCYAQLKSIDGTIVEAPNAFSSRDWSRFASTDRIDDSLVGNFIAGSSDKAKEFLGINEAPIAAKDSEASTEPPHTVNDGPETQPTELCDHKEESDEISKTHGTASSVSRGADEVQRKSKVVRTSNHNTFAPKETQTTRKRKTKKRRRPNYDPKEKVYVEPTDEDVLFGRGGRSNKHPGNIRYHAEKMKIQPRYLLATKEEKTDISQELVDIVKTWGGRFLKLEEKTTDQWFVTTNIAARKKVSQALRELNTPDERQKKRARYT